MSCPYCGEPLKSDNEYSYCINGSCSYIESDDMSYEEICEMLDSNEIAQEVPA